MAKDFSFVHVGHNNVLNVYRVVALMTPASNCARRMVRSAKQTNTYLDCCMNKPIRSVVVLDDGRVLGSTINTRVLQKRFNEGIDGHRTVPVDNGALSFNVVGVSAEPSIHERAAAIDLNIPEDDEEDTEMFDLEEDGAELPDEDDPEGEVDLEDVEDDE